MTYLVKIGGSLTPAYVPALIRAVKGSVRRHPCRVFLFPGGGAFADLIRRYRKEAGLSSATTHKMALASLDQNAYLMADVGRCECLADPGGARACRRFPVVIAPYRYLSERRPFRGHDLNIDTFSSDSSAAYWAHLLKAKLIIATDVDGVYERDPAHPGGGGALLSRISPEKLKTLKRGGPLDETLPRLIARFGIETWVVNGKHPERIAEVLRGKAPRVGTFICP